MGGIGKREREREKEGKKGRNRENVIFLIGKLNQAHS